MKSIRLVAYAFALLLLSSCAKDPWQALREQYLNDNDVAQLLLVKYQSGSDAQAELWVKENTAWTMLADGPVFVGKNGLGKEREGDMKTPIGDFRALQAFGILPDPGTALPYVFVTESIYGCDDDPRYYNTLIDTAVVHHICHGEHLIDYVPHYHYGLTISYNEEQVMGLGSCIFVHCKGPNPYTAGCVALDEDFMKLVLQTCDERLRVCIH